MRALDTLTHHPILEQIVDLLEVKVQNKDRKFFRALVVFFFAKMAGSMRANVVTRDRGEIPINLYTIALAVSGLGKGHTINLLEREFLGGFQERFTEVTFPELATNELWSHAVKRAVRNGTQDADEFAGLEKEFKSKGELPFTFSIATPAAVQQVRQKLLLGGAGALNMQVDEIGSNLIKSQEALDAFLELYDVGMIKQILTKNTAENQRSAEIVGMTPTNMLLFGTPSKLLDGSSTEDAFFSFLEAGYARRCFFAYGHKIRDTHRDAKAMFEARVAVSDGSAIKVFADWFTDLADPGRINWKVHVPDDVAIELMEYQLHCEALAESLPEHESIRATEIQHRYFKTLKLAATYAFIEGAMEMTMDHLHAAMCMAEESGAAFEELLTRDATYVRLAKFLAAVKTPQTHADLTEKLIYYKQSSALRREMMEMAASWGHKNHMPIRKFYEGGIEMFQGEALEQTDTTKMLLSCSTDIASGFAGYEVPFEDLADFVKSDGMHWATHIFHNQHRSEENTIPGFNLLVLDVDGDAPLHVAHELLQEYKFITYTTKRHDPEGEHRYRLILPMTYKLKLEGPDYREFFNGVLSWLPLQVDDKANQRSRKWRTYNTAEVHYNDGLLFDPLPFIPKTHGQEEYQNSLKAIGSLSNLERWFAGRMVEGDRNNQMLRFAMALVDGGLPYEEVQARVLGFNAALGQAGLSAEELQRSVLVTAAKKALAIANTKAIPF